MPWVRPGLDCLVEEALGTAGAIGAVVELAGWRRREPGPKAQDRHELVVVPLGRREVGDADADVIDESGPGHLLLLPALAQRTWCGAREPATPRLAARGRPADIARRHDPAHHKARDRDSSFP